MIDRLIVMFITSGVLLGLVAAYMISAGTDVMTCIIVLAIAAFMMAIVMVNIALKSVDNDRQGGIDMRIENLRYEELEECEVKLTLMQEYIEREEFPNIDMIRLILGMQKKGKEEAENGKTAIF